MQSKCLDYLKNLLTNYKGKIQDDDVFRILEGNNSEKLLHRLVLTKFPIDIIKNMEKSRNNGFQLELDVDPLRVSLSGMWNSKHDLREKILEILPQLIENAKKAPWGDDSSNDIFHDKAMEIQRVLKLNDTELDLLLVSLAIAEDILWDPLRQDRRGGSSSRNLFLLANCLNLSEKAVMDCLSEQKPLRRFHCLDCELDITGNLYGFLCGFTDEPLTSCFFSKNTDETLPWSDFADLAKKHGTILKRMLTSSDSPVNILLYGAPGTGKTSFAKTLAKEIGRTSYSIAQEVADRGNRTCSTPDFRFGALEVCDGQVTPSESVIIIDEADDMLRTSGGFGDFFMLFGNDGSRPLRGDKGLLNSVLDRVNTSTIWITNTPAEALDPSSRRRFDYSICFEPLNSEQRKRIWKNNISRMKLGRLISAKQIEEFSTLYPVSAGGISQTLENLRKMHPRKSEVPTLVEQLMKPHCKLLGVQLADDKLLPSKDYSLDGLNISGDVKLERIVEAIRAFQKQKGNNDPDRPRMNLLLSGAPGTGKTEFVKYLGDVLKTKVNVRMGSDLLSMWVGGTEHNIANAFREAEAEHAILFLDELDGLVQDRSKSQRSWEVTQVNELLHQMENFNGVMIGATNFLQNLDPAIMRRFTFKLQFNHLDDKGKRLFFERMFKSQLTDEELDRLNAIKNLAPGDFRTVRQSLFYYGGEVTNAKRLEALEIESAAKNGNAFAPQERIGF